MANGTRDGSRIKAPTGYLVNNHSGARGGVHLRRRLLEERRINGGVGSERRYEGVRTVDDHDMVKCVDAPHKAVQSTLRRRCGRFGKMFFCDEATRRYLAEYIANQERAQELVNREAKAAGCAHRGRVLVTFHKIDLADPAYARAIFESLFESLESAYAAAYRGDARGLCSVIDHELRRAPDLVFGVQCDMVRTALDEAKAALREIRKATRGGEAPESVGARLESSGQLDALGNALDIFDDARIKVGPLGEEPQELEPEVIDGDTDALASEAA